MEKRSSTKELGVQETVRSRIGKEEENAHRKWGGRICGKELKREKSGR